LYISIIGLELIGGSFARTCAKGVAQTLIGVDASPATRRASARVWTARSA
jgi:prephenate dehydrogenase